MSAELSNVAFWPIPAALMSCLRVRYEGHSCRGDSRFVEAVHDPTETSVAQPSLVFGRLSAC